MKRIIRQCKKEEINKESDFKSPAPATTTTKAATGGTTTTS